MNDYSEWKWSIGESYYKSARFPNESKTEPNYESTQNAIKQSLESDDGINDGINDGNMINITNSMFSIPNEIENSREELGNKMSGRDLTSQCGTNPFMGQTSYVNDVVTRDMFLKPINTTQGAKNKHNSD